MQISGRNIHLVGAKGTGMAALAEILAARGASLTGADVAESFPPRRYWTVLGFGPGSASRPPACLPTPTG